MAKNDRILDLLAALSVVAASAIYSAPFLMIGVWLTGVR